MAICVRKALTSDAEVIAKVHVDTWRATYQGIIPDEYLSNLSYDQRRSRWDKILLHPESQDATYVAEDDSKTVLGWVSCGLDRDNDPVYKGEVYGLYVIQKMQRRGIGRRLMLAAVQDLKHRGFNSMMLWVLADNPSRYFYEKLGGEHVQTRDVTIGGKVLKEFGYGWKNLDSVAPKNARIPKIDGKRGVP
jgi:GNAT superfamily N-acetyltransferase